MNPWLVPVLIGSFGVYALGLRLGQRALARGRVVPLLAIAVPLALPAILFVLAYTPILREAAWFYSFRALPGTECSVVGVGLAAGLVEAWRRASPRVSRHLSAAFVPFLLLVGLSIPYLKQVFLQPDWSSFRDRWSDGVSLQSAEASCGPASAATFLRLMGKAATEKELAREAFTSRRGTENWYLVRTLRRHGLGVRYAFMDVDSAALPFPAIVGVQVGGRGGLGHFIVVFGRAGEAWDVGDPLSGRARWTEREFRERYFFTGFAVVLDPDGA